jgi:nucleoside-diphosphate-sugar epimerase
MRVLVTGHAGYIGSVLVPLLEARGHQVRGLDTMLYEGRDLGAPPRPIPAAVIDIRDVTSDDLVDVDAVVHLAGICNDPLGELNPELTEEVNGDATARLAKAATAAGVERFVFSSTCSVYGWADPSQPVSEDSECRPLTAYARSKLRAEPAVLDLASRRFTPVVLRSGSLFGPSPRLRTDLVVNGLTATAWATHSLQMETDGSPWRPLVHVGDVAAAMIAMLEAPAKKVRGQTFNVGTDALNVQVVDIANAVAEAIPGTSVELARGAGPDDRSYRATFRRLGRAFPQLTFQTALRPAVDELVAAYAAAPLRAADLESGRFARLAAIKDRIAAGDVDPALRPRRRDAVPA